jgi:hypothetical protein
MKILLLILLFAMTIPTQARVHVNGYTKKNGTYVAPYTRHDPQPKPHAPYPPSH